MGMPHQAKDEGTARNIRSRPRKQRMVWPFGQAHRGQEPKVRIHLPPAKSHARTLLVGNSGESAAWVLNPDFGSKCVPGRDRWRRTQAGRPHETLLTAGQTVGGIKEILPVAQIMRRLVTETEAASIVTVTRSPELSPRSPHGNASPAL